MEKTSVKWHDLRTGYTPERGKRILLSDGFITKEAWIDFNGIPIVNGIIPLEQVFGEYAKDFVWWSEMPVAGKHRTDKQEVTSK